MNKFNYKIFPSYILVYSEDIKNKSIISVVYNYGKLYKEDLMNYSFKAYSIKSNSFKFNKLYNNSGIYTFMINYSDKSYEIVYIDIVPELNKILNLFNENEFKISNSFKPDLIEFTYINSSYLIVCDDSEVDELKNKLYKNFNDNILNDINVNNLINENRITTDISEDIIKINITYTNTLNKCRCLCIVLQNNNTNFLYYFGDITLKEEGNIILNISYKK